MLNSIIYSSIWMLGIIYGITPLLTAHRFGMSGEELYPVDEYFTMRIIILLSLATVGSLLWSVNIKLVNKTLLPAKRKTLWACSLLALELSLILLGFFHVLTGYSYFLLGIFINGLFFYKNLLYLKRKDKRSNIFQRVFAWLSKRNHWNAIFYLLVFLILITHNTLLIVHLKDTDGWHKLSLFLNRFFNQLAIVSLLYLIIQSSLYVAPKWSRSIIWIISAIIPVLIVSDYLTHTLWNTSLMSLINASGIEAFLDPETALKGGGIQIPFIYILLQVIAGMVLLFIFVWLCNLFSKRLGCKMSPRLAVALALFSIMGATVEQAIGTRWKDFRHQAIESSEFDLQVSVVNAEATLAEFDVVFKDHPALARTSKDLVAGQLDLKRKPDIHLILIESFRADALNAKVSPNLYAFQQEEAQLISRAWSCSNGTHVSWFGTFSGRLPLYWKMDKDLKSDTNEQGLKVFKALRNEGYELNAYVAAELAYRDMGKQFFGEHGEIFMKIRDNRKDDPIFNLHIPERESLLLEDLKSTIMSRDNGGHFDILGLDSSHFFYTWHKDFDPPFKPYSTLSYLPSNPNDEELQLVINKYHNSVAWCDHLVGDFLDFLKEQGKYDESIVIVMGDHGEELQEHGGWLHVSSLEEEQIRVPMLIKWPKSYGRGVAQETASQLDLLPSLLDYLTDGEAAYDFPGRSLLHEGENTIVAYTGMGGKTKDALVFIRDGYKAHFSWVEYWNWRPSNHIHLTQFYGPDGRILFGSNEEYLLKLKEVFPDVKDRFFHQFGIEGMSWEAAQQDQAPK